MANPTSNSLRGSAFIWLELRTGNLLCSEVFPGLWIDVDAMLAGNLARVLEVLQQGIASSEHKLFMDRYQQ